MKHGLRTICFLVFALCLSVSARAFELIGVIGGDMSLRATGTPDAYILTVNLYVDRSKPNASKVDGLFACHIYRRSDGKQIESRNIFDTGKYGNLFEANNPCAKQVSLLITKWTFERDITLSKATYNDPGGYFIYFERCCRETNPVNILNPSQTGMALRLDFFPTAAPNSTPEFTVPEAKYACKEKAFTLSFAAKDADGDQLEYALVDPLAGFLKPSQVVNIAGDLTVGNVPTVQWAQGSGTKNPIPGVFPLQISGNGLLTLTPSRVGLYLFAVMVTEKRNGAIISQTRREYQIPVVDCELNKSDKPLITTNGSSTTALERCDASPVTLATSATATGFNYQWQLNGKDIAGATSSTLSVTDEGTYTVKKQFPYGCGDESSSDPLKVLPPVPPSAKILTERTQLLFDGDQIILRSAPQPATYRFAWTFGGATSPGSGSLIAAREGTYKLRVTTSDGRCPAEDEIDIVRDIKLFMPSAFTPNGDGTNDTWQVVNLTSLDGAEVFVFNRNGGVVYYADKDGRPWDGTYENQKVPAGVYRYLVRAPGRRPQEGALHVIY